MRTRFLLPGGLLSIAVLGTVAFFVPATQATADTPTTTTTTTPLVAGLPIQPLSLLPTKSKSESHAKTNGSSSCGNVNIKGVTNVKNTGNPFSSSQIACSNGQVTSYGNSAITYTNPPASWAAAGKLLFDQTCSSCHGSAANGVNPNGQAAIGPNLQGVGTATIDFWVSTGRMPAADIKAIEAERKPPRYNTKQTEEIAAYVNSLDPAAPAIPTPNVKAANLADGASLFSLNCAACHTITGAGDALAFGTNAPSLQNRTVTPQQVAEAMRIGPANMPRFSGNLTDAQVRDVVAYVTEDIQHPASPGGAGLGGVGPVAEGFVALLLGVGGLALICFWIGERS